MEPEILNIEQIMQDRARAVETSIRTVSLDELRVLVTTLFPIESHPWNQAFRTFLDESADDTFFQAKADDQIHIVYCSTREKGIWYIPEKGVGILQPRGLKALKQIVANSP
jgi:hypothetical protein